MRGTENQSIYSTDSTGLESKPKRDIGIGKRWSFNDYDTLLAFLLGALNITYQEYIPYMQQLARGCVGIAMFRLGYTVRVNKGVPVSDPPHFPHLIEDAKIFVALSAAEFYRNKISDETGKVYHIIAMQVDPRVNGGIGWKIKPGRQREIGEIFLDELTGILDKKGKPTAAFNFATLMIVDGLIFWEWMNYNYKCPSLDDGLNPDYSDRPIEYVIDPVLPESYGRAVYIVAPVRE